MLQKGHLINCYNNYLKEYGRFPMFDYPGEWLYLGYMEACLVQFGVIESKNNGLADYALKTKKWGIFGKYGVEEDRKQIILRLVNEYLNKEENG